MWRLLSDVTSCSNESGSRSASRNQTELILFSVRAPWLCLRLNLPTQTTWCSLQVYGILSLWKYIFTRQRQIYPLRSHHFEKRSGLAVSAFVQHFVAIDISRWVRPSRIWNHKYDFSGNTEGSPPVSIPIENYYTKDALFSFSFRTTCFCAVVIISLRGMKFKYIYIIMFELTAKGSFWEQSLFVIPFFSTIAFHPWKKVLL